MEINVIGSASEPIASPATAPAPEEPVAETESRPPEVVEDTGTILDMYA